MAEDPHREREVSRQSFDEDFDELWRNSYGKVYGYCYRRTGDPADPEDATADVFVVAWRHLDEVVEADSAISWLYGAAYRVLSNQHRGRRRAARLMDRIRIRSTSTNPGDLAESVASMVDAEREAEKILARLNPTDREILRLAVWEGLSQVEIGRVVRLKAGTVRTRMYRIRKSLAAGRDSAADGGQS